MEDNVTDEEKHRRFSLLLKTVEAEAEKRADAMVGKTVSVLVDSTSKKNDSVLSGYAENGKLIHFQGSEDLVGKIVKVHILESHLYSMMGEIVHD